VTRRGGGRPLAGVFSETRAAGGGELGAPIQEAVNERGLGFEIVALPLVVLPPPVSVAADYQAVVAAGVDQITRVLEAEAYQQEERPRADGEVAKLKQFLGVLRAKPELLWEPNLDFFREYLLDLGATLPDKPKAKEGEPPKPEPAKAKEPEAEPEAEPEEQESDVELDMEGVIEADNDPPQEMGDANKGELSEEEQEQFAGKRSEALSAFSEGEWQKAIDLVCNTG